ncbi:MAG: hypothetical protein U9O50_09345 [Acidobacteriota bacterium]|nr:hypothetical protein [Acidobacteriota bacterium]
MKRISYLYISVSLCFLLLLSFCGKKGPILPPVVKIPKPVKDYNAIQRGNKIVLEWSLPNAYTDGSPMTEIEEVEIWLWKKKSEESRNENPAKKEARISIEEFQKKAKLLVLIKKEDMPHYRIQEEKDINRYRYIYELSGENVLSEILTFSFKVKDGRKRLSAFSELLVIHPKILPPPPINPRSVLFEEHIKITWEEPEKSTDESTIPIVKGYNIYRSEGRGRMSRINTKVIEETAFLDKNFEFGVTYCYMIRATVSDSAPFYESDDSKIVEIFTKDVFPPDAPVGLIAIAGEDYISLSWDVNSEKDLAGYRIWRKKEEEQKYLLLTPDPVEKNVYNDTTVEKNIRYYYAISALDACGNESNKSKEAIEIIKEGKFEDLSF